MHSIYHFFKNLYSKKKDFVKVSNLQDFPYDSSLLSCRNKGKFPDMAIRINANKNVFTGGELIELKDSDAYVVSSFNSTIPTGKKEISKIVVGENSHIKQQMEEAGNDIDSLPIRNVFYLVWGGRKEQRKCVWCMEVSLKQLGLIN
jgi:hypothetical protein